jgi:hypothetical protein
MEQRTLRLAASFGLDTKKLRPLHVNHEDIAPGHRYKVDTKTRTSRRCAGVVAAACTQGKRTKHGKPKARSATTNRRPVRDRPGALGPV